MRTNYRWHRKRDAPGINSANVGKLFRDFSFDLMLNFVPICSRVFGHIRLAQTLLGAYPMEQAVGQSGSRLVRIQTWLQDRCRYDCADQFTNDYRNLAYELMIPYGARNEVFRNVHTKNEKLSAMQVLEHELGFTTTEALMQIASHPIADESKDAIPPDVPGAGVGDV